MHVMPNVHHKANIVFAKLHIMHCNEDCSRNRHIVRPINTDGCLLIMDINAKQAEKPAQSTIELGTFFILTLEGKKLFLSEIKRLLQFSKRTRC